MTTKEETWEALKDPNYFHNKKVKELSENYELEYNIKMPHPTDPNHNGCTRVTVTAVIEGQTKIYKTDIKAGHQLEFEEALKELVNEMYKLI